MMKTNILLLILICVCGCSNRSEQPRFTQEQIAHLELDSVQLLNVDRDSSVVLDLNDFLSDKVIKTSEFVDHVTFIPLETTDESLIGEINKMICTEDRFFIFDYHIGQDVFIFTRDGKFICKIPKGGGPREIIEPYDIAVDEEKQHLIITGRGEKLSFFDFNGKFIKAERQPFYFTNFRVIPEVGYLFVTNVGNYNVHLNELSNMQVLITDSTFRIIAAGFPFHYAKGNNYETYDFTSSNGNKVSFAFKFSDKIYQLENAFTAKECYQLDFTKKMLPEHYIINSNSREVLDVLKHNDYYYYMGDFVPCETHDYFPLNNDNRRATTFIFRDKSTGRLIGGNRIHADTGIPLFAAPLASYKDEFVGVIEPVGIHQYLSTKEGKNNEQFKGRDDDSNPVLIKYKLKRLE